MVKKLPAVKSKRTATPALLKSGPQELKYVRHSVAGFFVFKDMSPIFHKHVGEMLQARGIPGEIMSAGFCKIHDRGSRTPLVECYGRSDSLDIGSRRDDANELSKQFGFL